MRTFVPPNVGMLVGIEVGAPPDRVSNRRVAHTFGSPFFRVEPCRLLMGNHLYAATRAYMVMDGNILE